MLRLLIAALGCITVASAASHEQRTPTPWQDACRVSRYSCFLLREPHVVNRVTLDGALGKFFRGDAYVLIDSRLDGARAHIVSVHEIVHYLQDRRGAWKNTHASKCSMEKEAFEVSSKVAERLGEPDLVVDWNKMRLFYGC